MKTLSQQYNERSHQAAKFITAGGLKVVDLISQQGQVKTVVAVEEANNDGLLYRFISSAVLAIAGDVLEAILVTGSGPEVVSLGISVSADEKLQASFHEAPTYTGGVESSGNVFALNRNSDETPGQISSVLIGPAVTDDGLLLGGSFSDNWLASVEGGLFILKPSTSYLLRLAFDKNNADAYVSFDFTESL